MPFRTRTTRGESPDHVRNRNELDIKFPTPIPVHITYQTAFVDEPANCNFARDIYSSDAKTLALLHNASWWSDQEAVAAPAQPQLFPSQGRYPAARSGLQ